MLLKSNPVLYACMQQIIDRGTAEILEENENGIFLRDTLSNAVMLETDDIAVGIEWLKKYEHFNYHLIAVFKQELVDFIKERYSFRTVFECFHAVYFSEMAPAVRKTLQIRAASEKEIKTIAAHYDKANEEELRETIRRGELFVGYQDKEMIGFVGMHLEGSMGILEVFPQYRRKGYGTELESFMISHVLKKKLIPFCQVEVDNENSLAVQRKLGLTISKEKVYFLICRQL